MASKEDNFANHADEIIPNLFLGDWKSPTFENQLKENGITHVISVCESSYIPSLSHEFVHMKLMVQDVESENLLIHFPKCLLFINDVIAHKSNVLIHCMAGVSRSTTIVMAYLMAHNGLSFSDALQLVQKKRNIAYPNSFQKQLKLFEQMGCIVDRQYTDFRILDSCLRMRKLMEILEKSEIVLHDGISIDNLFEPDPKDEDTSKSFRQYFRCRICDRALFSDKDILHFKSLRCSILLVSLMIWMKDALVNRSSNNGLLNCVQCKKKIGIFFWKMASHNKEIMNYSCCCGENLFHPPSFIIYLSRIKLPREKIYR